MKAEDFIEGNIKIDIFMGYTEVPKCHYKEMNRQLRYFGNLEYADNYSRMLSEKELKYHSSWEWLMEVVDKIETIQLPSPAMIPVAVSIKGQSCRIFKGEWNDDKEGFLNTVNYSSNKNTQFTKKISTWLTVVLFIDWYNLHIKK